jgi:hypothetical protein
VVAREDRQNTAPAAAAAPAVARSPPGCASDWKATGATITGCGRSLPSSVVRMSTVETSTITRGRIAIRRHARSLSRSVISSPAPPA